jgi:peptidoglycan/xylan/chitin deacetylase (PgdA/CDA1 family)
MILESLATAACATAGLVTYAVRSKSSTLLSPSVYRGPLTRTAVALTFDDGPSESTPELLDILAEYQVPATFFQCGVNVRRLPGIAQAVAASGHEIGNHTEHHSALYLKSPAFIYTELAAAQEAISEVTGPRPRYFRPPYGARWFGLRAAQRKLNLQGVMWTCVAQDWRLPTERIVSRVIANLGSGTIHCLHDGRQTQPRPNVRPTLEALRSIIPEALERGFEFVTISQLLCPKNPHPPPPQPPAG